MLDRLRLLSTPITERRDLFLTTPIRTPKGSRKLVAVLPVNYPAWVLGHCVPSPARLHHPVTGPSLYACSLVLLINQCCVLPLGIEPRPSD